MKLKDKADTVELTNASKEINATITALDKIASKLGKNSNN